MTRLVAVFGLCSLTCWFGWQTAVAVPPPLDSHHPLGGLRWQAHPGCQWGDGWDSWPLADFPVSGGRSEPSTAVTELAEVTEPAQVVQLVVAVSAEPSRDWTAGWELQVAPPVDLGRWPAGWVEAAHPAEAVAADTAEPGPLQSVLVRWRRAAAEQHLAWISQRIGCWSERLHGTIAGETVGQWWGRLAGDSRQIGRLLTLWTPSTVGFRVQGNLHPDAALPSPGEALGSDELGRDELGGDEPDSQPPHLAAGPPEALTH
jgi:hypothetical protein